MSKGALKMQLKSFVNWIIVILVVVLFITSWFLFYRETLFSTIMLLILMRAVATMTFFALVFRFGLSLFDIYDDLPSEQKSQVNKYSIRAFLLLVEHMKGKQKYRQTIINMERIFKG